MSIDLIDGQGRGVSIIRRLILRKMEEDFGPNSKLRGNKDEANKKKK